MNCVIPGSNLKVLGKALQALSRFGNELYIEPSASKLSIRTVNLNKTAYGVFDFNLSFFAHYQLSDSYDEDDEALKCKIPMKSIIGIFKNTAHFEKNVLTCKIEYDPDSTKIMFKFRSKHDVTKTHYLYLLEGETLQAFYLKDDLPNTISANHSVFSQALQNFQINDSEISFIVSERKLLLRNFIETEVNTKMMRSQLTLHSSEFPSYNIGVETDVRFPLKQFRAAINFSDAFNLGVTLNFDISGKPIVLIIKNDGTFEANFVMSTLKFDGNTQSTNLSQNLNSSKNKRPSTSMSIDKNGNRSKVQKLVNNSTNGENNISIIRNDILLNPSPVEIESDVIFKRCFELTIDPLRLVEASDILVENSDPEDY